MVRSLSLSVLAPALVATTALAACEPAGGPAPSPEIVAVEPVAQALGSRPILEDSAIVYRCANGERLRVDYRRDETAIIEYRGETKLLTLAPAASGARYVGDGQQWWIKGQIEGVLNRLEPGQAVATADGTVCRVATARPAQAVGAISTEPPPP
ncbi:MliC family protein [Phenylobacterium sp.]|uniref:MliC family protein n=1 Tax=Phenylobacterium sp. TaxID=1871053 RepID=UPI002731E616|nr:MliC family protein [Phenylobacterium sp.]MDP1617940.1 MliC family protein [Phenylobacterium sp.]MDP1986007.1 MliC family protein [Phenylobacterium sp.]